MTADTLRTESRSARDAPQRTQEHGPTPRQADTLPMIHGSERATESRRSEAAECTAHLDHARQDAHRSHRTHGESRTPSNHDEIAPRQSALLSHPGASDEMPCLYLWGYTFLELFTMSVQLSVRSGHPDQRKSRHHSGGRRKKKSRIYSDSLSIASYFAITLLIRSCSP